MSSRLSIAVLVRQHRALAFGYHTRGPCPRGASTGRATRGPSWSAAVLFAGLFPTSATESLSPVASCRGSGRGVASASAARNLVSSFCDIPVGVGLRRSPSNHALQPPVRSASGRSIVVRGSAAPRPAAERER